MYQPRVWRNVPMSPLVLHITWYGAIGLCGAILACVAFWAYVVYQIWSFVK